MMILEMSVQDKARPCGQQVYKMIHGEHASSIELTVDVFWHIEFPSIQAPFFEFKL